MSSGNLTADRRYDYAQSLRAEGDFSAAAELIGQALELAPNWAEGRFAFAENLADAGRLEEAVAAYRAYLMVDSSDSMGAAARLTLLGAAPTPANLPAAYVSRLFDEYAPRFDAALTERLGYQGPALLKAAVTRVWPRPFSRVFDLGCGTGLSGAAFRDVAAWLGGVDLSPAMVRKAEAKKIYDHLEAGDMGTALATLNAPCELILAADVLVYVGDLAPLFAIVRNALVPGGIFAFTVQRADSGDYALGREQRYSHSRVYIERCAEAADFEIAVLEDVVTRQEAGKDVPGLLAVLV
ncbi:MAG: methyltransferase [Rhodospirillaceae bacterium]